MAEPWFVEAFRADYVDVYPHRDEKSARAEAAYLVERGIRGLVLDLCCGFGRHCLALREQGVLAFGIDLSRDLLRRARGLSGRILCGDARAIPFAAGRLDGVVSLFSSFGYFGEDGDRRVLSEVARVLRPGGFLVLDLMNPARVRASLVPRTEVRRGEVRIEERRSIAENGQRVVKDVHLRSEDGSSRIWREEVRLYDISELSPILSSVGLALADVHGDFDGSVLSPTSPRQILWVRRR